MLVTFDSTNRTATAGKGFSAKVKAFVGENAFMVIIMYYMCTTIYYKARVPPTNNWVFPQFRCLFIPVT